MENRLNPVVKTLLYSAIFKYPLTRGELYKFLITNHPINEKSFQRLLSEAGEKISVKENYYFLKGSNRFVLMRKKNISISEAKLSISRFASRLLSCIPTVLFIGISGSLAMKNSEADADIDFFIITKKNTLWITRLLCLCLLELYNLRRKRQNRGASNKICLNMLIDTSAMSFPSSRQDLYTAHEIIQMKPMISKKHTYEMFMKTNAWIGNFLANSVEEYPDIKENLQSEILSYILYPLEKVIRHVQLFYMKKSWTTETVTDNFVAFHPLDYKQKVLVKYNEKIKTYV